MNKAERRWHRRDVLMAAAKELEHHMSNGSEWLYSEDPDDGPSAAKALNYRIEILNGVIRSLRRRANRISTE